MSEQNPCIICVAITGSVPTKADNPAVPITVAEQIESTQEAFEAGASIAHCHVRNDDGTPSSDPEKFAALKEGLEKHCPGMIIQLSTGGRSGAGKTRGGMLPLSPDMASLSVGSNNFPTRVYENPPDLVDWLASEMRTHGVKPEIEAFDLSHIHQAVALNRDGRIPGQLYVQFVMGVKNAMPVDRPTFDFYVETVKRLAPEAQWCAAGIGRHQITLNEWAIAAGGHCRTGLEDNVRLDRDTLAPSNAALVRRAVAICEQHGRPVATPAQARQVLELRAAQAPPVASPVRIAIVGAGLIGRRHVAAIEATKGAVLAAIVDPTPEAAAFAREAGVPCHAGLEPMLEAGGIDGAVIATPNALHAPQGLACIAAGIPVLIEKPLAADEESAADLVQAAEAAGVPILTGHHRRHNPLIAKAREIIAAGMLGRIVTAHGICWFRKPDAYFAPEWRRSEGAGPILLNLIHDVDLLRHLCGEISSVQAVQSNAARGFGIEDTAAVLLQFTSGAVGSMAVSDAATSPWSWELTARENPAYPATPESCYQIGGTEGALALPNLTLWRHSAEGGWWSPITATRMPHGFDDPLVRQIAHFVEVVRGEAAPLVSGREGLANMRVIAAIRQAARSGQTVGIADASP